MNRLSTGAVGRHDVRLVVVDSSRDGDAAIDVTPFAALPSLLAPGDLVIVNDAATLPASFAGITSSSEPIEVRLIPPVAGPRVAAVLFGAGDHTTPTEHRPPPPPLAPGDTIALGGGLRARVVAVAGRQATLDLDPGSSEPDALWQAIYTAGRPVQYAHRSATLPLWAVQTVYASRPWSAEMPSAGRPLTWETLLALRRRGVGVASLTHAAGLSATGDPILDAALPLPEPYDIPAATVAAIAEARARRGRVIAIGTTVVRALESAAAATGEIAPGPGLAALVITPAHRMRVVDGIVSGLHGPEESHFRLLGALVARDTLDRALDRAAAAGLHGHELGDTCLIAPRIIQTPSVR
jgi:S-adenosylmethionine:tRNA ribosyltransferase-isomerase